MLSVVKFRGSIDMNANFRKFDSSFMLLFRCSSGEGWNKLMYEF